jgi:hypothetical protein
MSDYDEERIAKLLQLLPPAPEAWVRAAQELPAARAALDDLVARAEADAVFRERVLADLEGALSAAGVTPSRVAISRLRQLLSGS